MNTHHTTPTQFIEATGIRFAYRRFANPRFGESPHIPLLFFMHFTGTMDRWRERGPASLRAPSGQIV